MARHVLPDADGFAVRAAADSVSVPHTWLKVPMEPEDVGHWLTEGWAVDKDETGYLMAVDLRSTDPVVPEGYSVSVETHDGVVHVRVHDAAGDAAARGQMVVVGRAAVVDKVGTDDTHRRRGLGAFVMRAFADHAVARGAVLGVLGATPEGRSLYENLGWKVHAPLAACIYKP
ncbi:GNAT family N-acetyltransferase [Streptomyces eurocidicus]|uniref:GNAT superfamily N-acetyltransferase n=1 Tax=Streptomyces eurocidicus TaxID=66423 RepID=A0A7W8BHS7_STREU|nr:GNAT family N-acetyltransferase [Streptomyces eurocidicus]MBB5123162.1 GNAT superfamily N-acetyltransferase [Streptomyces eurocidicus]